jgi:DNA-binding SARP family transcriptional activator
LKVLAANRRRSVPKEALIEMLWPGADPATGSNSLKVAAHNLRSSLEPDRRNGNPGTWIMATNGSYSLRQTADLWIDVEQFERYRAGAQTLESSGAVAEAREAYKEAEALYGGDYLEEDLYEDWTIIRREELKDVYLAVLGKLAHLSFAEHAYEDAVKYCHKILLADPCREDAYQLLMRAHAGLNQMARAGAWYAVCRTMLMREMGAEPSGGTRDTFERLFEPPA